MLVSKVLASPPNHMYDAPVWKDCTQKYSRLPFSLLGHNKNSRQGFDWVGFENKVQVTAVAAASISRLLTALFFSIPVKAAAGGVWPPGYTVHHVLSLCPLRFLFLYAPTLCAGFAIAVLMRIAARLKTYCLCAVCIISKVCLLYILMKSSRSEQGAHVFTCCGWCNALVAVHHCSEPYASILIVLKLTFRSLVRLLQQGCRPLTLESR